MQCRRVALCLPHFRTVFDSQRNLACPNCGGRQWLLRTLGDELVPAALQVAVEASGGRVEADAPPAKPESSRVPSDTPWSWLRADQLPHDARVLDRGVLAKIHPRGAALIVDGEPFDWICDDLPLGAARAAPTSHDLVVAHGDGRRLTWAVPERARLTLRANADDHIDRPLFVDARRLVYVQRDAAGHEALWEGVIEPPGRIRQRRIASLGRGPRTTVPPAVVRRGEAVVALVHDGDACAPAWIRLSDGQRTPIAAYASPARALRGARRGEMAAWIDSDGTVRAAGLHHPMQTLGRAVGDVLALTEDGRALAWLAENGPRATVCSCDLRTGATERLATRGPLVWLGPRGA